MIKVTYYREGRHVHLIVRSGPEDNGHMPLVSTLALDEKDAVRLIDALRPAVGIEVVER